MKAFHSIRDRIGSQQRFHGGPCCARRGWRELCQLGQLSAFVGIAENVAGMEAEWKRLYDSQEPHKVTLPGAAGLGLKFRVRLSA